MPRLTSITGRALTVVRSILEDLTPLYSSLEFANSSTAEGSTATLVLTTQNIPNGTTVNYTTTGISSSDIDSGALTGVFTITDNSSTVVFEFAEDGLTEGTDTLTVTLASTDSAGRGTGSLSASTAISDTSFDSNSTPWLDDTDTVITVRSIIGGTSMTFNGEFAVNPTVPLDIEGRTSGTTTTVTAITANTGDFFEVNDTGNSTNFVVGEEINIVAGG